MNGKAQKRYRAAKILTAIPLIVFVVAMLCFITAGFLERPTNRGSVYSLLMFISLVCMFLLPIPCLIISFIGTIFAHLGRKGLVHAPIGTFILGLIEIIFSLFCIAVDLIAIFYIGPGV